MLRGTWPGELSKPVKKRVEGLFEHAMQASVHNEEAKFVFHIR